MRSPCKAAQLKQKEAFGVMCRNLKVSNQAPMDTCCYPLRPHHSPLALPPSCRRMSFTTNQKKRSLQNTPPHNTCPSSQSILGPHPLAANPSSVIHPFLHTKPPTHKRPSYISHHSSPSSSYHSYTKTSPSSSSYPIMVELSKEDEVISLKCI